LVKEVKKKLLNDNSIVSVHYGCIKDQWSVRKILREMKYWYSKYYEETIRSYMENGLLYSYAELSTVN
jgi:hypothetical protein